MTRGCLEFGIDSPTVTWVRGSEFLVTGWAVSPAASRPVRIWASNGDTEFQGDYGLPRPDIGEHFADKSLANCGFVVRVRVPRNGHTVRVWLQQNGNHIPLVTLDSVAFDPVETSSECNSYQNWIRANEPRLFIHEPNVPSFVAGLEYRPLISILLPTYNTPNYFLRRCLHSVVNQQYWNWQLCIADDNSTDEQTLRLLASYGQTDTRIHVARRASQGGISAASNTALQNAKGEYVVLLDHDDELHPAALLEVVRALNNCHDYKLLYSDEDKIDQYGVRSQPAFKPDFDSNIFLSFNYLGHLIALDREVVSVIGGFRSETDGAQDWDLLIRATERIPHSAIQHICKPLYHWRIHDKSTSTNLDAKPYVAAAWQRVLRDHATRTQKHVHVTPGLFYGSMRLQYEAPPVTVGVLLRSHDGAFQSSIIRSRAPESHIYKVVGTEVIPEGATSEQPLLSSSELRGDVFVFFNAPLESLSHLFFRELVSQALRPECGLATGMAMDVLNRTLPTGYLADAENSLSDPYTGIKMPQHGYMGQLSIVRSIEACSPLMFAVRREHLMAIGGIAAISSFEMPRLASLLSRHAREKGFSVIYTPYAVASFSSSDTPCERKSASAKYHEPVRMNPHLRGLEAILFHNERLS